MIVVDASVAIKWFLLDGWLNILYLVVFTVIVILWRPTENNKVMILAFI